MVNILKIDRTVENIHSLQWDNEEHSSFTCIVKFAEFDEEMPFTATPNDIYEHTLTIWSNGVNGVYGNIKEPDIKEPDIKEPD